VRVTGKRVIDAEGETTPTAPFAYGGAHSNGSQPRMNAILEDPATFTDAECRVITWYLFNSPGQGEPVRLTATEIAKRLGMSRPGLTRIMKRLRERRILIERDRVGQIPFYALSPYIGGQGPGIAQRAAIRDHNPPDIPGTEIKAAPIATTAAPWRTA
jgi:DNA-binding transcriptional ArsR family regulator